MAFLSKIFINALNLPEQTFFCERSKTGSFRCTTATFVNRSTREVNLRCRFLPSCRVSEEYEQESGPEFV